MTDKEVAVGEPASAVLGVLSYKKQTNVFDCCHVTDQGAIKKTANEINLLSCVFFG